MSQHGCRITVRSAVRVMESHWHGRQDIPDDLFQAALARWLKALRVGQSVPNW